MPSGLIIHCNMHRVYDYMTWYRLTNVRFVHQITMETQPFAQMLRECDKTGYG